MQNINLFQPERPTGLRRPAPALVVLLLAGLLLGVMADGGWLGWQLWQLRQQQQAGSQRAVQAEAMLKAAQDNFHEPVIDPALESELARLRDEQQQIGWMRQQVQQQLVQHGTGFSGLMNALSERHLSGLWLDRLAFSEGGRDIALQGVMTQPALLPVWLDSLGRDARLGGRQFAQLAMQRAAGGQLHFSLASRLDEDEEAQP